MSQLLLADLALLSSESKRRSPEVKVAADAALASLKADFDGTIAACRRDASKSDSDIYTRASTSTAGRPAATEAEARAMLENNIVLKPIVLACGPKAHIKVTGVGVTLLQRVVAMKIIPSSAIAPLVDLLAPMLSKGDVELLLKLLQTFSALLLSYPSIHDSLLSSILHLCFRLQDSKVQVVSSTAAATVRQTVMIVFEKVGEEDRVLDGIKGGGEDAAVNAPLASMTVETSNTDSVTLFPSSADAYRVLADLNRLAQDEPAEFLMLSSLPRTFTLELLESILTNHASTIQSHPELLFTLRRSTCPLLIKSLSGRLSFPVTLRFMRLLFIILKHFSANLVLEVEILMNILLRSLALTGDNYEETKAPTNQSSGKPTPTWLRIIALEVTRSLCSEGTFLRNLWKWYDGSDSPAKVFSQLADALTEVATEAPSTFGGTLEDPAESNTASARPSVDRQSSRFGLIEAAAGMANAVLSSATSAEVPRTLGLASAPGIQFIDQLEKADAPQSSNTYVYLLASQSLVHFAQSLAQHVLPVYSSFVNSLNKEKAGEAPPPLALEALSSSRKQDMTNCKSMAETVTRPLATSFRVFLSGSTDDAVFSEILVAVRNWTNMCGVLGEDDSRNVFLTLIAKLSSSNTSAAKDGSAEPHSSPTERNLAALRVLVHVTKYLSGILERDWLLALVPLVEGEIALRRGMEKANTEQRRRSSASQSVATPMSPTKSSIGSTKFRPGFSGGNIDPQSGKPQALLNLDSHTVLNEIHRVFENTTTLSSTSLVTFLEALCFLVGELARRAGTEQPLAASLPTEAVRKPSTVPLFAKSSVNRIARLGKAGHQIVNVALDKAGIVVHLNVVRLATAPADQGWQQITEQLLEVASAEEVRSQCRSHAVQVLTMLLTGAVSLKTSAGSISVPEVSDADVTRIQSQIFPPLRNISTLRGRTSAADLDVRRIGIEALKEIVESHGFALRLGWEAIFDIMIAACGRAIEGVEPSKASPVLVKAAFPSLKLICDGLLNSLSTEQLNIAIQALECFTVAGELNIALTAASSLWSLTEELVGRRSGDIEEGPESDLGRLWVRLLFAFKKASGDERSEVRDAAISALFRVLSSYGQMLSPETWLKISVEVLFPILESVTSRAAQVRQDEAAALQASLATPTKQHRARRTSSSVAIPAAPAQAKRWEESCVVALQQLGATFGDFMLSKIILLPTFLELWQQLLAKVKVSFLSGPPAISQASIKALESMLKGPLPVESDKKAFAAVQSAWRSAWETWASIGDALEDASPSFSQANLLAYLETFDQIYRSQPEPIELEAIPRLHKAMTYSGSPDLISDVDVLSAVQRTNHRILNGLKEVPGLPSQLLRNVAERISLPFTLTASPASASGAASGPKASYVAVHKAAVDDALKTWDKWQNNKDIYTSGALNDVLAAISTPIKLRYECPAPTRQPRAADNTGSRALWQDASLASCRLVQGCCRYISAHEEDLQPQDLEDLWRHLLSVFQAMLTADCSFLEGGTEYAFEDRLEDQSYDLIMLSTFETEVLPILGSTGTPSALIEQFAAVLSKASQLSLDNAAVERPWSINATASGLADTGTVAHQSPSPRERTSYASLDLLFLICSDLNKDREPLRRRVAALSMSSLMQRASHSIKAYTSDALLRGGAPFPLIREQDMLALLNNLVDLKLPRGTYWESTVARNSAESIAKDDGAAKADMKTSAYQSPRAHLFVLHSQLLDLLSLPAKMGSLTASSTASMTALVIYPPPFRALAVQTTSESKEEPSIGEEADETSSTPPPPPSSSSSSPLLLPPPRGGWTYRGRIGHANVLDSRRPDRDEPKRLDEVAREALDLVGEAFL